MKISSVPSKRKPTFWHLSCAMQIANQPGNDRLSRGPDLIFEIVSGHDARAAPGYEGVGHFVLVYPVPREAKVYRLVDGDYCKVGDFSSETHSFDLSKCSIDFDFSRVWRRKSDDIDIASA